MSMPKVEIKTDASGRVMYSVTEEGVLLTKEQAERIASRIAWLEAENERLRDGIKHDFLVTTNHIIKLEELVRDMWRNCICQSDVTCNTCVVDCNVTEGCALERRITELGIEVER